MKAFKLFNYRNGRLYPLYVNADKPVQMHEWLNAECGERLPNGKVKAKLGNGLAYRPGWHLSLIPYAGHIGKKDEDGNLMQRKNTVWCECDFSDEVDYNIEAAARGWNGERVVPIKACLDHIPENGFYYYNTNSKATGFWVIAGKIRVNKILTNDEVDRVCRVFGIESQKREA